MVMVIGRRNTMRINVMMRWDRIEIREDRIGTVLMRREQSYTRMGEPRPRLHEAVPVSDTESEVCESRYAALDLLLLLRFQASSSSTHNSHTTDGGTNESHDGG